MVFSWLLTLTATFLPPVLADDVRTPVAPEILVNYDLSCPIVYKFPQGALLINTHSFGIGFARDVTQKDVTEFETLNVQKGDCGTCYDITVAPIIKSVRRMPGHGENRDILIVHLHKSINRFFASRVKVDVVCTDGAAVPYIRDTKCQELHR